MPTIDEHIATVAQAQHAYNDALAAQETANSNVAVTNANLTAARDNLNQAVDQAITDAITP